MKNLLSLIMVTMLASSFASAELRIFSFTAGGNQTIKEVCMGEETPLLLDFSVRGDIVVDASVIGESPNIYTTWFKNSIGSLHLELINQDITFNGTDLYSLNGNQISFSGYDDYDDDLFLNIVGAGLTLSDSTVTPPNDISLIGSDSAWRLTRFQFGGYAWGKERNSSLIEYTPFIEEIDGRDHYLLIIMYGPSLNCDEDARYYIRLDLESLSDGGIYFNVNEELDAIEDATQLTDIEMLEIRRLSDIIDYKISK